MGFSRQIWLLELTEDAEVDEVDRSVDESYLWIDGFKFAGDETTWRPPPRETLFVEDSEVRECKE